MNIITTDIKQDDSNNYHATNVSPVKHLDLETPIEEYDFFIKRKNKYKKAVFDSITGKQLSRWYRSVRIYKSFDTKSEYPIKNNFIYLAQRNDLKWAMFEVNRKKAISPWVDYITEEGVLNKSSNYYIIRNNDKRAICHKNNKKPKSQWFDWIYSAGLINGVSDYYIASNAGIYYIYDINNNDKVVDTFINLKDSLKFIKEHSSYI